MVCVYPKLVGVYLRFLNLEQVVCRGRRDPDGQSVYLLQEVF